MYVFWEKSGGSKNLDTSPSTRGSRGTAGELGACTESLYSAFTVGSQGDFTSSISLNGLLNQVSYPDEAEGVYEATVSLTELTASTASPASSSSHSPFAGLFKGEQTQVTIEELTAEVTTAFTF